jgi:hypothetical protein
MPPHSSDVAVEWDAQVNRVSTIAGNVVKRPSGNHPDPERWEILREYARDRQRYESGEVYCATCPETEGGQHRFELHHRHYNYFGAERVEDVVLLCAPCHDAITNRLRNFRLAHGDMTMTATNDNKKIQRSSFVGASRISDVTKLSA